MSIENIIDEMDLPLANSNIELETISRDNLKPLFKAENFIIRDEDVRDNGIDLTGELIINNKVTNFRFAIQLKATESSNFNKDGSFSLSLNTSNINYLLNNGMPAFYVLYSKSENVFYYENINAFVGNLNKKDANWNKQQSHVLRFTKKLNTESIHEIFDITKTRGLFQRKITEKHILLTSTIQNGKDRVHFDKDLNITDDTEIRNIIEDAGFELINKGKWIDIINFHKKASGNISTTSVYNLILGVSNYYSGNLIDAYSFLKKSTSLNNELSKDLKEYLSYFLLSTKYSLNFIDEKEYQNEIGQIDSNSFFYSYTKLEKIKYDYSQSTNNPIDAYNQLINDINAIIINKKSDDNLRMCAKIESLFFQGSNNNMIFFQRISHINGHPILFSNEERIKEAKVFIEEYQNWNKEYSKIESDALEKKNYFNYYLSKINKIKIYYELDFMSNFLITKTNETFISNGSDKTKSFNQLIGEVSEASQFYKQIGHIENLNVTLSLKYELLKYIKKEKEARKVEDEIRNNLEIYDLNEQKRRFEYLIDGGTKHELFIQFIDTIHEKSKKLALKLEKEKIEMQEMDKSDLNRRKEKKGKFFQIHLFPIGYFEFPKEKTEKVYQILSISNEIQDVFKNMFGFVIPIANIYYDPIIQEGHLDGKLADKGFESWKRIYQIRKDFFDNEFYRMEIR